MEPGLIPKFFVKDSQESNDFAIRYDRSLPAIKESKLPLTDDQAMIVNYMHRNPGLLVSWPVGFGKTLTAVASAVDYLIGKSNRRVVVITPKSLRDNFKKEMKSYGVSESFENRFIFFTYDKFKRFHDSIEVDEQGRRLYPWKHFMLIIDEVHNLRTKNGKRVAAIIDAATRAEKRLTLTATIFVNNMKDTVNLAAIVHGCKITELNYLGAERNRTLNGFANIFQGCISFISPELAVRKDFPFLRVHSIWITMDDEYYREYRDVEMNRSEYYETEKKSMAFYSMVRQAANEIKDSQKGLWAITRIIEWVSAGEQVLVSSNFITHGVVMLARECKKFGIKYRIITGKTHVDERKKYVDLSNRGRLPVLFITKAGAEGLDLVNIRKGIFIDPDWNAAAREQKHGRIYRKNGLMRYPVDERIVDIYDLYMAKSPEQLADPKGLKSGGGMPIPSADTKLFDVITNKEISERELLPHLSAISIDRNPWTVVEVNGVQTIQVGH